MRREVSGTAAGMISDLDGALVEGGQDALLRRTYGRVPNLVYATVIVRTRIANWRRPDQEGAVVAYRARGIMSPTQIWAKRWPGGELPTPATPIPWLPRHGDEMKINGHWRAIEVGDDGVFRFGNDIVRIEFDVLA